MIKITTILLLAASALAVLLPQYNAKVYNDYISINSRVPGDELILHLPASQELDFFAEVKVEVRYPEKLPNSDHMLTHIFFNGQESETGYINSRFDRGGPGYDFMRMKIFLKSIKNGKYDLYVYGKKK